LAYPSTIFISPDLKTTFLSQGYLKEQDIEPFLVFMVENVYKSTPFNTFQSLFKDAFYNPNLKKRTNVKTFKEIEAIKNRKKTAVFFYTNFCNSCKVMTQALIHDSLVADVLNKYFHTVVINAEEDTIVFKIKSIQNR
jgi:thioredoxin-related protein